MKALITALLSMLFTATPLIAAQPDAHVSLDARAPAAQKAGVPQECKIFFHPKKGIHINLDPSIEVSMGKNPVTASVGKPGASKDAHGYLNPAKPVIVALTLPSDAPKGTHRLTLKVVYFLCSDAEGWCNREEQLIVVPVTVK